MKRILIAFLGLFFIFTGCNNENGDSNTANADVRAIETDENRVNTENDTTKLGESPQGEIDWHTDWKQALADAEAQDKLIMLDIYTDWCTWCKELDEKTYVHPDVVAASKDFINIKLNPETQEEGQQIAMRFNVTGYPAILFIDPDMNLVGRVNGFMEGPPFKDEMVKAQTARKELAELLKGVENGDVQSLEKLIDLYIGMQREEDAARLIIDNKKNLPEKALYEIVLGYYHLDKEDYMTSHTSFEKAINLAEKSSEDYYHAAYMKGYMMFYAEIDGSIEYLQKVAEEEGNTFKDAFLQLIDQLGGAQ